MTTLSRRELFDRIWSTPMTTNAIELGASSSALANLAKRLGLPMPRAGHWLKTEVGKEQPTPDFPSDPGRDDKTYSLQTPRCRRVSATPPATGEAPPQPTAGE